MAEIVKKRRKLLPFTDKAMAKAEKNSGELIVEENLTVKIRDLMQKWTQNPGLLEENIGGPGAAQISEVEVDIDSQMPQIGDDIVDLDNMMSDVHSDVDLAKENMRIREEEEKAKPAREREERRNKYKVEMEDAKIEEYLEEKAKKPKI